MIKELVTKTFKPGTYKIEHEGIYTYIQYYPIKGSTMVSTMMIPKGSSERIIIKDDTAMVMTDAVKFFESLGFKGITQIEAEDEYIYRVYCTSYAPNMDKPHYILNVCSKCNQLEVIVEL